MLKNSWSLKTGTGAGDKLEKEMKLGESIGSLLFGHISHQQKSYIQCHEKDRIEDPFLLICNFVVLFLEERETAFFAKPFCLSSSLVINWT